jgi:thioredoxin-like negative regulator of GroEL
MLALAALAAGAWFGYRAYYGSDGWTAADADSADAAPAPAAAGAAAAAGSVIELNGANFDDFVAADKTPALIAFYRTDCPYCRASQPALERLSLQSNGRYRVGKLDVEAQAATAEHYPIHGVPTFIFFSKGRPADGITGAPAGDEEGIYEGLRGLIDKGLAGA